jgi:hypothetical protein
MTYEVVLEESYQPEFGRPYQSETVLRTMLTLMDAKLIVAEYNTKRLSNQYYFYRETK